MKRSDIKDGVEYAYASNDYQAGNSATRVRVTGSAQVSRGYGYNSSRTASGVAIERLDSDGNVLSSGTCMSRCIREEWETYSERVIKSRALANAQARKLLVAQDARAARLVKMIPALLRAGVKDTTAYVYNETARTLLLRHVAHVIVRGPEGEFTFRINAPLASSISSYVLDGTPFSVPADDLIKLLLQ